MGALNWAQRRSGEPLKRVFNTNIAMYSLCGGTLRIIAEITDPDVIQKILHHMSGPPGAQPLHWNLLQPANPETSFD